MSADPSSASAGGDVPAPAAVDRDSSSRAALREALADLAERTLGIAEMHPDRLAGAGFPDRSFREALVEASSSGGIRPYVADRVFRKAYADGRIRPACLRSALARRVAPAAGLDRIVLGGLSASRLLELALLSNLDATGLAAEAALEGPLLAACLERVLALGPTIAIAPAPLELRHRDGVVRRGGEDPDPAAHAMLAAYLDAFLAASSGEGRIIRGFYAAFRDGRLGSPTPGPAWLEALHAALASERLPVLDAEEALASALDELEVPPILRAGYLGSLARIERRAIDRLARATDAGGRRVAALGEVLAVRSWIDVFAVRHAAHGVGLETGRLRELLPVTERRRIDEIAPSARAHQLARVLERGGLEATALENASAADLRNLFSLLDRFDSLARAEVWQDAFDRSRLERFGEAAPDRASGGRARAGRGPEPISMREAIAMGPSLVLVGRRPLDLPIEGEAVVVLPYDASADADGSELASIARVVPAIVECAFARYLRETTSAPSHVCTALAREIVGVEAVGPDALDVVPWGAEWPADGPAPGTTILSVEASHEQMASLLARDARLRDLVTLGFLAIARLDEEAPAARPTPLDPAGGLGGFDRSTARTRWTP